MLSTSASTTDSAESDDARWRALFEHRRGRHADLVLEPCGTLAPAVLRGLTLSLPTFQLGETGDGSHLASAMTRAGVGEDYRRSVALFIEEEGEHARLLAGVMDALDLPTLDHHWTDAVFQTLRRFGGLEIELLILMIAETVSVEFYAVLRDGVGDPALTHVFQNIQDDEEVHLRFHLAAMPPLLAALPAWRRHPLRLLHAMALAGSVLVVSLDHRVVLRACGVPPSSFAALAGRRARTVWRGLWKRMS